jgi:tripartite-type tricarboxylate transporter receptor subunit TctC
MTVAWASGDFPTKDIRLVLPFGPGGATDVLFRDIAEQAQHYLAMPIAVENITGSGATRGSQFVKDATADGYTLLGSHQTIDLSYFTHLADYSHRAFAPIALLTRTINIPATYAGHRAQRASDIAALVAEQPGQLLFGVVPGSTDHFFWLHFFAVAGIAADDVQFVHYPDTASQVEALLAKELDFSMLNLPSVGRLFAANALTPLGVAGTERLNGLAELPTLQEQGIDLVNTTDRGLFAPLATPPERLQMLAQAFGQALAQPELAVKITQTHGSLIDFRPLDDYAVYLDEQYSVLQSLAESFPFKR